LKTVGLLSLMAQSGIPIPADAASRLPVFDCIFADIGDEQSIAQTLSSFSWHMSNVGRIVREATAASLVLMDELGTSTDPVEGSALAASILTYFLQKETTAIATSHFNELKALAHKTAGLQNAAFEFDPQTLAPTFRLITGIPGGSNALVTASRLGIPSTIIEAAKQRLNSQARELDSLLFDLSNEQNNVRHLRDELSRHNQEAAKVRQELERRSEEVRKQEKAIIDRARDQAVREISALTQELKSATSRLRRDHSKQQVEMARNSLRENRSKLEDTLKEQAETKQPAIESQEIRKGDIVWLKDMEMEARIVAVNKPTNQVTAEEGSCRFTIGMDRISREKPHRLTGPQTVKTRPVLPECPRVSTELDLRGKRADEIEWLLDSYLSDASLASLETARIIHGHGSGVVKQIVREYVAAQPLVKSFRPGGRGEGGDGVTVINLT
jgi:DNA mismatch repair protein MutS2